MQRKENGRKKEAETQIRRSPQKERETEFFLRFFPRRKTTTERRRRRAPLDIFESSFALCSFSTLSFGCARRGRTIGRQTYFIRISLICVIFVKGVRDYSPITRAPISSKSGGTLIRGSKGAFRLRLSKRAPSSGRKAVRGR